MRTIAALAVAAALGAALPNPAIAQAYGLLPPYEALTIARSMGFDPIGRPVLRGSAYVVRAIDEDDFAVRVVVDARTGRVLRVREDVAMWPGPGIGPRYAPGWRYGDYAPIPPTSIPRIKRPPPQRSAVATGAPVPRARPADAAAPATTGSIPANVGATLPPGGNLAAVPAPGHSVPAPVAGRSPPAVASAATAAAPATPAPASAAAASASAKMQLVPVAPLD